ncbi:MAG TPA: hypothetical protein DCL81_15090 [Algoriphagus sp.]|jgi:hypothetical protein|uniref:hypothetical protein n=1 Tax=Algoriphagus sp. TaxID=1872435 RepID=UPI000C53C369|nr:hypothetical protein [Algoriphagus sp.]MAL13356.1 hypothetical protein [Algoriphagus sp.]MAN85576.1 hypothetical protein [Algoriphagus sp.]HAH37778.1 hypothetical protein [Algoriphagus sp.]HAS58490.1 hypothetical protein [Algoriphagus sp.]HCB47524.1 hypothetical protein [Algoriphagus sp.]|tara:strand:- start:56 stop:367 length:312 start_codon:yes stop_codon:yes gene_type:complete
MSTRANIKFQDGDEFIHIDRSHDGFPENILADIKEAVDLCKGRWSGAELGQLVSAFLGLHFDKNRRIQHYEPCIGYETAGDESYCYYVRWNSQKREYEYGVLS